MQKDIESQDVIKDFIRALQAEGEVIRQKKDADPKQKSYKISDDILNMFSTHQLDATDLTNIDEKTKLDYFKAAKSVYERTKNSPDLKMAIFYRLEDVQRAQTAYDKAWFELKGTLTCTNQSKQDELLQDGIQKWKNMLPGLLDKIAIAVEESNPELTENFMRKLEFIKDCDSKKWEDYSSEVEKNISSLNKELLNDENLFMLTLGDCGDSLDNLCAELNNINESVSREQRSIMSDTYLKDILEDILKDDKESSENKEIKKHIIQYSIDNKLNSQRLYEWYYDLEDTKNNKESVINKLAQETFYPINITEGKESGSIYTFQPGMHNWGVNVAWIVAILEKNIPINIHSKIDLHNMERRNTMKIKINEKEENLYSENPSAFTLEIAMAIKYGYSLEFKDNNVSLIPPKNPNPSLLFTNGQPGNGILPTKTEQLDTFRACVLLQHQHNGTLGDVIERACSGNDETAKKDLVNGLQFLNNQGKIEALFRDLKLKAHSDLNQLFSSPPYDSANYSALREQLNKNTSNLLEALELTLQPEKPEAPVGNNDNDLISISPVIINSVTNPASSPKDKIDSKNLELNKKTNPSNLPKNSI